MAEWMHEGERLEYTTAQSDFIGVYITGERILITPVFQIRGSAPRYHASFGGVAERIFMAEKRRAAARGGQSAYVAVPQEVVSWARRYETTISRLASLDKLLESTS